MTARRTATLVAFAVTFGVLVLQIFLTVSSRLAQGDSLVGALVFYFTFFTILTNLMVAAVYLSELVTWRWLEWWRRPWARAMTVATIVLVMLVYHFILSGLADFAGWFLVADRFLHYVDPTMYALWWLLLQPHGKLRWGDLPKMLIYPLVYVVWAMARGAVLNEYPYPFLAADKLGYPQVLLNCLGVLAAVVVLCALVIGIDRALGRTRR
jgi:hypothetical protein